MEEERQPYLSLQAKARVSKFLRASLKFYIDSYADSGSGILVMDEVGKMISFHKTLCFDKRFI
jgi:hypothetical protein